MADFLWTPKQTTPVKTEFNSHQTPSEVPGTEESLLIDTTSLKHYKLFFPAVEQDVRNAMYAHMEGQYGPHAAFYWKTVPGFINNGNDLTVKYVSYDEKAIEIRLWRIEIVFKTAS